MPLSRGNRAATPWSRALAGAAPDLVAAVLANGLLCCASAAPHLGLWRLHAPERLHLLCRHGAAAGVVVHRGSLVPPEFPRPVAGLTDTLLHALRCLPPMEAAVMVESALSQGRTTLDYLRATAAGKPERGRPRVLELVDGTADSAIEVVARLLFRARASTPRRRWSCPGSAVWTSCLRGS